MADLRRDRGVARELERLATRALDPRAYLERLSVVLERHDLAFIGACWHLTDPSTGLITWTGYGGTLPGDWVSAFENEFLEDDVAKYADLATRRTPVATVVNETRGRPTRSARYRHHLAPAGFADELRIAFTDPFGRWGSMGLFNDTPYSDDQQATAAGVVAPVARALREATGRSGIATGEMPGVIILDPEDRVQTRDDRAGQLLAGAVTTGRLPGTLHILAARARATGGASRGRTLSGDGEWLAMNASELSDGSVAIVLRPEATASVLDLRLRAAGLTTREREVAIRLLRGESTATIARALYLSPWTVQDHLKSIFNKTEVRSRPAFVAHWALEAAGVHSQHSATPRLGEQSRTAPYAPARHEA